MLRSSATAAVGVALLTPLRGWLEPLAGWPTRAGTAFSGTEVEALEQVVQVFRGWRSAGSGWARSAVLGQLADVTDRVRGAPDDALTARVFLAGAELAKIAGAMAVDGGAHRAAQQHYVTAVQLAKAGRSDSLSAVALAAMARLSYDTGRAGDGLELVQLAQHGTRRTATPGLAALLATREAWGYAQTGRVFAFHKAVGLAEETHAHRDAASEPRWLAGLDAAELAGTIGARFRDLAHHDPSQARHAVTYTERALTLRGPDRTRNRAMDLISLARTHLLTGEPEQSCALIGDAVQLVDRRHPGRLAGKLADFDQEATPYANLPTVRDVRVQLRDLAAV